MVVKALGLHHCFLGLVLGDIVALGSSCFLDEAVGVS